MKRFEEIRECFERENAENARKLAALNFDWRKSPRTNHRRISADPVDSPSTLAVQLADGRNIALRKLDQYFVYAGTLCGVPPSPSMQLLEACEVAQRVFPHDGGPVILEPVIHTAEFDLEYPRRVEWLLKVCTLAVFESNEPAHDPAQCYSSLTVVWFQDTYRLAADRRTNEQLIAINWAASALGWTPQCWSAVVHMNNLLRAADIPPTRPT